jgi:hypothetical protein
MFYTSVDTQVNIPAFAGAKISLAVVYGHNKYVAALIADERITPNGGFV